MPPFHCSGRYYLRQNLGVRLWTMRLNLYNSLKWSNHDMYSSGATLGSARRSANHRSKSYRPTTLPVITFSNHKFWRLGRRYYSFQAPRITKEITACGRERTWQYCRPHPTTLHIVSSSMISLPSGSCFSLKISNNCEDRSDSLGRTTYERTPWR
jgi:hypothetical protein